MPAPRTLAILFGLMLVAACQTPVGVERLDAQMVHRELTGNVLTDGTLSQFTENVLHQHAVAAEDGATALAVIHAAAIAEPLPETLFALAELSFAHAEKGGGKPYFFATTVYASAFLFPADEAVRPSRFDPRFRWAADLYNRALTQAFKAEDGHVVPKGGNYMLPSGTPLTVKFDEADLVWHDRQLTDFVPVAELRVRGLNNRYRQTGLGAPLAAGTIPIQPREGFQVGPRVKVPVTALLSFEDPGRGLQAGRVTAQLHLFTATDPQEVNIADSVVPLEAEPSAALAYTLSNPAMWSIGLRGFFRAGDVLANLPSQLGAMEPYRPGRIPVVFVHGTASSAGRWGDMVNDLQNDPLLRNRFQFWFFVYETGNPVPYSALQLRDALEQAVADLDPDANDRALRQMVVIGHSQGGLLTKMTAIDTGSRLFDSFAERPLDELRLRPETRELLRRTLFIEPLPFVSRLVFISTPHGGSYLTEWSLGRMIARLVRLPLNLATASAEVLSGNADALRFDPSRNRFGSMSGMTPGGPLVTGLRPIPIAPGVAAHSIIPVEGDGPPEEGSDGVVRYQSAHIEGVESELVVRDGHSTQGNPVTIAEVRRILLLHAEEACTTQAIACAAAAN